MKKSTAVLPEEWMRLVKGTMNLNVSKEEFKQFLEEKTQNNTITKNIRQFLYLIIAKFIYYLRMLFKQEFLCVWIVKSFYINNVQEAAY